MPPESTAHAPNLSRPRVGSGVVGAGSWYRWGMTPSTFGSVDWRPIGSSLGLHLIQEWWTWNHPSRSEPSPDGQPHHPNPATRADDRTPGGDRADPRRRAQVVNRRS